MMAMGDDADPILIATRRSLHALAVRVISPLRVQATGNEIALQVRPEGFGTPELPEGGWVGVRGTDLVRVDADGAEDRAAITSLLEAADFVGLDDKGSDLTADRLEVHAGAAAVLADAWARGDEALAGLSDAARPGDDASPVHLWPEHFDIAVELGAATFWSAVGFTGAQRPVDDPDEVLAFFRAARDLLARG
jgi:hypothetical protein